MTSLPQSVLVPQRVYLAAAYRRKHELRDYAKQINAIDGYQITSSWLDEPDQPHNVYTPEKASQHADYAISDLYDIQHSDVFVLFAEADSTAPVIGGGRHFETGYAAALGIPIILIGSPELIFHHLPHIIRFERFAELLEVLRLNR